VGKTRDASDRLLPPERELRAPAPRAFPAHCRGFHRVDASWSLCSARLDRRTECFTTPETASADRLGHENRVRVGVPAGSPERGRIMPTAPSTIEPLTPLSPLPLPPCRRAFARAVRAGGSRRDPRDHRSVKKDGSLGRGCLPSAGTLRRIRWLLRPRPQDRPTPFREGDDP